MQMTPDTYESTKEGIESTKSTGDLATAGEEKTTLTKQTSQNMAETTEIVDNLCDGKIIVIGKNGNFNVLNRFLKIGEDWKLSRETVVNFPKIGNLEGWFNFDRLHRLPVDKKSQTVVKKLLMKNKYLQVLPLVPIK